MEIVVGVVVVVVLILFFGQMSLDKPLKSWSDEELVRRLPKYERILITQMQAGSWEKTAETQAKIDEIRLEMVAREQAFQAKQAEQLKKESIFGGKDDGIVTETAIAGADAGDVDLQVLVGSAYLAGANGLPQNTVKAGVYLLRAAESGHPFASFMVAGLYADGLGLPQDFDRARLWAVKAKSLGAPDADEMLVAIDSKRRQ